MMLDLFCGLGGGSAAMRERGWSVVGVDNEARLRPDVVADLSAWSPGPELRGVDLLWASPPCTEFARWDKVCWYPRTISPSLALVEATRRIIDEVGPRFWLIENVRGAREFFRPLLGPPLDRSGSCWVWGRMPALFRLPGPASGRRKEAITRRAGGDPRLEAMTTRERQRAQRARIPYEISHAVAIAIERATP